MSDKFARVLTGLAVFAVAVIAGIVSYSHIQALALAHGYTPGTARLLPLSVDGLVLASALVLLVEARAQRPAPRLARTGLWIAIGATLAANILHGVAYGPVGALANGWPAAAFILASEILLGMIRRAGTTPAPDATVPAVADAVPSAVPSAVPVDGVPPAPARRVQAVASGRAPRRASGRMPKAPEKIFAAHIESGELPSLREVKRRMSVGTPRAQHILADLETVVAGQQVRADA